MGLALQYISILIEVLIASMGILIVLKNKKVYGWGIFLTFFIYCFYDLAKLIELKINSSFLYFSFFIATLSAFWSVLKIYQEKNVNNKQENIPKIKRGKKK